MPALRSGLGTKVHLNIDVRYCTLWICTPITCLSKTEIKTWWRKITFLLWIEIQNFLSEVEIKNLWQEWKCKNCSLESKLSLLDHSHVPTCKLCLCKEICLSWISNKLYRCVGIKIIINKKFGWSWRTCIGHKLPYTEIQQYGHCERLAALLQDETDMSLHSVYLVWIFILIMASQ
jgi:hypothetical protein